MTPEALTYQFAAALQSFHAAVLLAALDGAIDADALMRHELAARGIGTSGEWVGYDVAEGQWKEWAA